jgi:alcohol dehydrogenase class IV
MAWASLCGGLALANAGLGAVHGFAAPIGGRFPAPHGAACAAVLPHAMEINVEALRERAPKSQSLERYAQIGRLLTGRPQADAGDAVEWVAELCRRLEIPGLRAWGVSEADIPALVEGAARASSMKANPVELNHEELSEIARRSL